MTTATEPPLIVPDVDVDELPAWDQPEERACELPSLHEMTACENPAAWLVTVVGPCQCSDTTRRKVFGWCDPHTIRARRIGVGCTECDVTLALGWIEPLR